MTRPDIGFFDGHKYLLSKVFWQAKEIAEEEGLEWRHYDICPCQQSIKNYSLENLPKVAIVYPHTVQPIGCSQGIEAFAKKEENVMIYIPILVSDETLGMITSIIGVKKNVTYVVTEDLARFTTNAKAFENASTWKDLNERVKNWDKFHEH